MMLDELLNSCVAEMRSESFQSELLDPIISRVIERLKPYVLSACLLFTLLISCVFFLVFKSIRQ